MATSAAEIFVKSSPQCSRMSSLLAELIEKENLPAGNSVSQTISSRLGSRSWNCPVGELKNRLTWWVLRQKGAFGPNQDRQESSTKIQYTVTSLPETFLIFKNIGLMGNGEAMGLSVINEETCLFFKLILAEILRNESITIHCYLAARYMFHYVLINENTTTPISMGSKNKLLNTRTQTLTQVADGISELKLFGERIGRDFPSRLRPSRFGCQLRL